MADRTHSVLFGEYYAMICFGGKPIRFLHIGAAVKATNLPDTDHHGVRTDPKTSIP